ncbi:unnamed protein product [Trichobilharzia regenti]|nr:unnamed protein product [Trichobilharzia regenti]
MVVPSATPNDYILIPRVSLKLDTYNVRKLMQIGQQAGFVKTLESLAVNVCCISEARTQNPNKMLRLSYSSESLNSVYHPCLPGGPMASGVAGVGVALASRAKAALLDWVPVDSRPCAVRLEGYKKVRSVRRDIHCLFVPYAYAPKKSCLKITTNN